MSREPAGMDPTVEEVAQKLLEHLHVNVADRHGLPESGIPFSVLVEAARRALDETPWLPAKRRPDEIFDGVILERRGSDYWVHERHEIGVNRYSEVRSQRAESLHAAVQSYVEPFRGAIDGIRIDVPTLTADEVRAALEAGRR